MRPKTYSILRYLLACTALVGAFAAAPGARAADSLAPPGAPRDWLPPTTEQWVYEHWLPYDQNTLFRILGVNLEEVRNYFAGSNFQSVPTLAALARSRGLSVQQLARELVNSWHPHVSRGLYALLLNHATRSLTQGHLMQHMLFHPFHDTALFNASPQIFGVSPHDMELYFAQGITRREVGHQHGRTDQQMMSTASSVLRSEEALGVRLHLVPSSEAKVELADQLASLNRWLDGANANPQAAIIVPPSATSAKSPSASSQPAGDTTAFGASALFTAFRSATGCCCCCCCCCCGSSNDSADAGPLGI